MAVKLLIRLIDFYRYFISPMFPNVCRFYPSCSSYAKQSLIGHGLFKGIWFSIIRISKCHPYHPGGFDPIPPMKNRIYNSHGK